METIAMAVDRQSTRWPDIWGNECWSRAVTWDRDGSPIRFEATCVIDDTQFLGYGDDVDEALAQLHRSIFERYCK